MKKIESLGLMGEKLVRNLMIEHGYTITDSLDPFDSRKDFIRDNKTCEVKTEQPYVLKNCFSFKKNQLAKCRNVDELYIVSVPPVGRPTYAHGGKIFFVHPKKFEHITYRTKAGNEMIGIPIMQPSVKCIYTMSEEEKELFIKYTESDYRKV